MTETKENTLAKERPFTDACRFMFGDSLGNAIEHIELRAIRDGSAEAFSEAYHAINGIGTWLSFMKLHHDRLLLSGSLERMRQMSENPGYRESIINSLPAPAGCGRQFRQVRPDYLPKAPDQITRPDGFEPPTSRGTGPDKPAPGCRAHCQVELEP